MQQEANSTDNGAAANAAATGTGETAQKPTEAPAPNWEGLAKEAEQKYLYLYADFENYKKRTQKEREELLKFGWESAASELIPVLDNLDRALQYAKPETDPNLLIGLKMVAQQFLAALEKQGIQTIQTLGQAFDPNLHEATSQESSDQPENTITKEVLRGYRIHGRLLRAAKVVVAAKIDAKNDQPNLT